MEKERRQFDLSHQVGTKASPERNFPRRGLIDDLRCIVFQADAETLEFTYVSRGAEKILGYPLDAWFSFPPFWLQRLVHPDDREGVEEKLRAIVREGRDDELLFRGVREDDSMVWLRATVDLQKDEEGKVECLGGFMMNVTEERQTEELLRRSEERLHLALDAARMGVWDWHVQSSSIYWSDQVYSLHGLAPEDFDGTFESYMRVIDRIHPDDSDHAQEVIRQALVTGEEYGIEYRVRINGGGNRWLFAKGRIYFDEDSSPARVSGTVHDITPQKQAEAALKELTATLEQRVHERTSELEKANAQLKAEVSERARAEAELERTNTALVQSNRELQDFAYVASHDLQEPLRKITTFADLLVLEYEEQLDNEGIEHLERIRDSGQRMRTLINALLEFSRVKTKAKPFARTDLNEVVRRVIDDLEIRIAETEGKVDVDELPSIDADPTQMRQLFQNLIGNALKFRKRSVPPAIRVYAEDSPAGTGAEGFCRIFIEDNGIGFEQQYADRIFAPFQRLHVRSEYEGTGIGLAICRRIVERHHGDISVTSEPGIGSCFMITLPVRQEDHNDQAGNNNDVDPEDGGVILS